MRGRLFAFGSLLVILGSFAVGCGGTRTVAQTVTVTRIVTAAPVGQSASPNYQWLYGRIASLKAVKGGYQLFFDPALMLGGIAANYAAAQADGVHCAPGACEAVPNDYFVADETHHLYVLLLPRSAQVHVLTTGRIVFPEARISTAQLAGLVAHGHVPGVKLFETLDSGVWLEDHFGTIRAIYQQYRP